MLNGWGKRGYNMEYTVAAQHQIADRMSVNGGYYRRTFGNQTFTDDLRYDANSYDSFCIRAPVDPDLPDGGGYQVCGVQDLKPSVFALGPAGQQPDSLLGRLRRRDEHVSGLRRQPRSSIPKRRVPEGRRRRGARPFDNCNLLAAGLDAVRRRLTAQGTEIYPDGSRAAIANIPSGRT